MKIFKFITVCYFMLSAVSFADVSPGDIEKSIDFKNLKHPYLYFNNQEKTAILERIAHDPSTGNVMNRLSAEAERLLYTPVVTPLPPQPRDSRFVAKDPYLPVLNMYQDAALMLAFMYQMTGEERYADKSFEFAEAICDLDTWVIRACQFPKSYFRVSPWNVIDDKVVFTFDIFAADTAVKMSAVYDWLYPWMNIAKRDRIRGALLEKAIVQARGNYDYQWWSTAYKCNWLIGCFSGLGMSALTLLKEDPKLVDVISESLNRINRQYDEIDSDGGWQEGVGYSFANQSAAVLYGIPLRRVTGGKYSLLDHPKLREFPVTFNIYMFLPPDKSVNFSDSGYDSGGRPKYVFNVLADEMKSGEAAWCAANIAGEPKSVYDVIFPQTTVKPELPKEASRHFRTIDWTVMRSDFTGTDNVVVACKSGKNDDPHHGHLDIGHFILFWRGQSYIRDPGNSGYDEKAFDATRWDMPKAASRGHNVVLVNGEEQIPGKRYREPLDESIGGKVLEFRTGPDRDYTLMDSSNAYPCKEMKSWRRHIALEKPSITIVLDEVESQKDNSEIAARFHSECTQRVMAGYTMLDGKYGKMALIPVCREKTEIRPGSLASLQLIENARLEWLPYIDTVTHPKGKSAVIAHIIVPVNGDDEASRIAKSAVMESGKSGGLVIGFVKDGKRERFEFKKTEAGLVLE